MSFLFCATIMELLKGEFMQLFDLFNIKLDNFFDGNEKYFKLLILSLLIIIACKLCAKLFVFIIKKINKDSRTLFLLNQNINIISNLFIIGGLFVIWSDYLSNFLTIISFISAGVTIAIREVILNFFAGIFIKTRIPFKLEDRIEINNIIGDVVVINLLSFKILEVSDKDNGEQSNGKIVNIPNSYIFSYALKNYTTAFKYIWDEMIVNIPLNADVEKTKKIILKIVNNNEVIKAIPKKMDKQVTDASLEYRIYYNHLEPIIYTRVVNNHIELSVRFLVHPKKMRNVENDIWLNILNEYKNKKITLFTE